MSDSPAYHRCSHCRGFYESDLPACKYCNYKSPINTDVGRPRLFPDRDTCRAIQIAEYEQLPPEAMDDPMKPPADELAEICACIHCGPAGPLFEAVEMRWIVNEQMWACPCTTCGGRGYHFDIHGIAPKWECNQCRHKWSPPNGNCKPSNCKCPKCGCTQASGMFQDEYSEAEIEAMTDEQYKEYFGQSRAEEEQWRKEFNEKWDREHPRTNPAEPPEEALPWEDPIAESPAEDFAAYNPEARAGEEIDDADESPPRELRMPDDIDFPHKPQDPPLHGPTLRDGDIPL